MSLKLKVLFNVTLNAFLYKVCSVVRCNFFEMSNFYGNSHYIVISGSTITDMLIAAVPQVSQNKFNTARYILCAWLTGRTCIYIVYNIPPVFHTGF